MGDNLQGEETIFLTEIDHGIALSGKGEDTSCADAVVFTSL